MSTTKPDVGRNDACPCGSGQKYKRCCGQVSEPAPTSGPSPADVGNLISLLNAQRLADAERFCRALLERNAGSGILWKLLSVALVRQGRDALEACRRAAALLPTDAEAQHHLGTELAERRQWPAAAEALRRACALVPANPDYLVDFADALREAGDVAGSLQPYQQALALDAQHVEAHNNLGNALMALYRPAEAVDCYQRARSLRPDEPLILCNLSNAQRQAGRPGEALASAQQALLRAPGVAMAQNFVGLALHALGRDAQAIALLREALVAHPREVTLITSLAQALRDSGARREALALCQRAVAIDPAYADGYCNLGNVQFDLREVEDAGRSFRRAVELMPRHVAALTGLALVLRQQRRHADAETACRAALGVDPRCVEALSLLGELRADLGEFTQAEAVFRQAIEVKPSFAFAYSNIAAHRRMTAEDAAWRASCEQLLQGPLPLDQRVSLHFALGKFFDDTRDYEQAFGHFRHGNELTRSATPAYDPAKFSARVERVIRACGSGLAGQVAALASPSQVPVLVVGMPRSGTSLTEQILASHGAVYGAGEVSFWDAAFDAAFPEGGEHIDGVRASGLIPAYLERLRSVAPDAERIVDKMPANFLYAGLVHALFPQARILHMRRHPVDTCLSVYFQNFFSLGQYTNDLAALVHYYREYERVSAHWRAVLPASAYLEVPYEELTADQERWTRRIVDFVGLEWDPRCLAFQDTNRAVVTASKWQVRQKMNAGSTGRWQHYRAHLGPLRELLRADEQTQIDA